MTKHDITDVEYASALDAGRREAETEFRAQAVTYLANRDAIEVIPVRNGGFVIPRHLVGALQDANPDDMAKLELWPDGSLIEIQHLDIHISVDGMIRAALRVLVPERIVANQSSASGNAGIADAKA
jgi:hypothetical protein